MRNIINGIIAGIVAGALFGIMLVMGNMLPVLGGIIGMGTFAGGVIVHTVMSIIFGAIFAILFKGICSTMGKGIVVGILYGLVIWVLGPMTLLPYLSAGVPLFANWTAAGFTASVGPLVGHVIFGFVLGVVFTWLNKSAHA